MKLEFGYYPRPIEIAQGALSISTLPDIARTRSGIEKCPNVRSDWIYPGNNKTSLLSDPLGTIRTDPYSVRVFNLPKTHLIKHTSSENEEHVKFHVWALSFFVGMRLATGEAGFLDATPIKQGKLTDFRIVESDLDPVIGLADKFWSDHKADNQQAKRLCAAIHALFIAQNPRHLEFEEFMYTYAALDACFAILRDKYKPKGNLPHSKRIEWMCQRMGMPVPQWTSKVSSLRNDAVHETLYLDEPLGFKVIGGGASGTENHNLEMQALACRILAAILGVKDKKYIHSSVGTHQIHGMRLS